VIYGCDGMDEATLTTNTKVVEIDNGILKSYDLIPEELGLEKCNMEELTGGEAAENAAITLNILNGSEKGAKKNVVVLNAAIALYIAGKGTSIKECIPVAAELIESGAAMRKLEEFVKLSDEVLQ
ncbi:MAG TPA: hypothetical protein VFC41_09945, partial [Anaerovoracaceae bacterium]|nr:hypothetical protein [Anaerovoracaceae bacterium]